MSVFLGLFVVEKEVVGTVVKVVGTVVKVVGIVVKVVSKEGNKVVGRLLNVVVTLLAMVLFIFLLNTWIKNLI